MDFRKTFSSKKEEGLGLKEKLNSCVKQINLGDIEQDNASAVPDTSLFLEFLEALTNQSLLRPQDFGKEDFSQSQLSQVMSQKGSDEESPQDFLIGNILPRMTEEEKKTPDFGRLMDEKKFNYQLSAYLKFNFNPDIKGLQTFIYAILSSLKKAGINYIGFFKEFNCKEEKPEELIKKLHETKPEWSNWLDKHIALQFFLLLKTKKFQIIYHKIHLQEDFILFDRDGFVQEGQQIQREQLISNVSSRKMLILPFPISDIRLISCFFDYLKNLIFSLFEDSPTKLGRMIRYWRNELKE